MGRRSEPAHIQQPGRASGQVKDLISERGAVRIDQLAADFGVSEMTIRRDLDELEALGIAGRVRGGAMALGPEPFAQRHRHNARAKGRIAEKLVDLIPAVGTVAFDASTTVHRLAASMEMARDLVIVTNGLDTFHAAVGKPGITASLTGGTRSRARGASSARSPPERLRASSMTCSSARRPHSTMRSGLRRPPGRIRGEAGFCRHQQPNHSRRGSQQARDQGPARMFDLIDIDLLVTDLDPEDERLLLTGKW